MRFIYSQITGCRNVCYQYTRKYKFKACRFAWLCEGFDWVEYGNRFLIKYSNAFINMIYRFIEDTNYTTKTQIFQVSCCIYPSICELKPPFSILLNLNILVVLKVRSLQKPSNSDLRRFLCFFNVMIKLWTNSRVTREMRRITGFSTTKN